MRFAVTITRRSNWNLWLWKFRRIAWRNSKIRWDAAGYANYESWWLSVFVVTVQWGVLRKGRAITTKD